ncbi:MAG TPA: toll/interleukin-1 receptor domain-containing protein, partial [Anaerolineales bacterium]|nr:toll/interleukin-1 receptor domain-containing protein [Anaerolineales bacterium]
MTAKQKGRIFLNYRRVDSEAYAGRIYDRLAPYFGDDAIFMDVDDIPAGVNFVKFLEDQVQSCDVLIALIGRQWLNVKDKYGKRRLDNPQDFVRIEIVAALKRDIRVIPVLLGGAQYPQETELPENLQPLVLRSGLPINHHSFHTDVDRLIKHLEDALEDAENSRVLKAKHLQEELEKRQRQTEIENYLLQANTAISLDDWRLAQ